MTFGGFGERLSRATSNGALARIQTALLAAAVAIGGWFLHTTSDNTAQISSLHTEVDDHAKSIEAEVQNLADTIKEHNRAVDASIGHIINAEQQQAAEISALQQAMRDRERDLDLRDRHVKN